MAIKAIAYSYWRRIKDRARSFTSIPFSVQEDVRTLARQEAVNGTISPEVYESLICEPYPTQEA